MKKLTFSKLRFSKFKTVVTRSVFGELQLTQISLNFKISCCNLKITDLEQELCVAFLLFQVWKELWRQRVHEFCWTKIYTLIKMKQNKKCKTPHTVLERRTLCFSSYKNPKLKVKLRWFRALEKKERTFFVSFILSEGNFFNTCVLCQCIVYWIHFQNIQNFTYQKRLLPTLFCLFLKSSKAFNVYLIC